jgi:steroid delta-isomerase-like uncharacterized protein
VRRWFQEVWNNRRESAIDEMFAADGKSHHLPQPGGVLIGPGGFKVLHKNFCGAFPDLHIAVEDVIAEGNRVAACWMAKMTHLGGHLGVAATGKRVELPGSSFVVIQDGKISEAWNFIDMGHLYSQLGIPPV